MAQLKSMDFDAAKSKDPGMAQNINNFYIKYSHMQVRADDMSAQSETMREDIASNIDLLQRFIIGTEDGQKLYVQLSKYIVEEIGVHMAQNPDLKRNTTLSEENVKKAILVQTMSDALVNFEKVPLTKNWKDFVDVEDGQGMIRRAGEKFKPTFKEQSKVRLVGFENS